jgi:hypothetical protein
MRLRLFDRIRHLVHRKPVTDAAPGAQGKHRRGQQHGLPAQDQPPAQNQTRAQAQPPEPIPPPASSSDWPAGRPGTADWATPGESPGPPATHGWPTSPPDGSPVAAAPPGTATGHRAPATDSGATRMAPDPGSRRPSRTHDGPAVRAGSGRARIREAPQDAPAAGVDEAARPAAGPPGPRPHWHEATRTGPAHAADGRTRTRGRTQTDDLAQADDQAQARAAELNRVAGVPRQPGGGRTSLRAAGAALRTKLPFTAPHARERPPSADGRRNCGSIERILWRQWDTAAPPPPEVIAAVDRLAELPERIKERLTNGLDAIFIGPGGVPELDEMTGLRGVPLPAGRATWDACAGAYGERKIVVGSRPSPTPDVMCHEVGHALDDLDSPAGKWQSDSAEFRMLYDQCQPHLASDFHHQPGGLGRKEFFADAFAAIASRQRPALVDMLSGDTRTALRVMLYFNRRYGI